MDIIEYFESFLNAENASVYKRIRRLRSGDLTGLPETNKSCLSHSYAVIRSYTSTYLLYRRRYEVYSEKCTEYRMRVKSSIVLLK